MRTAKKFRMASWYWGNYCLTRNGKFYDDRGYLLNISAKDLEEYDEKRHGWHNSEEYKLSGAGRYIVQD